MSVPLTIIIPCLNEANALPLLLQDLTLQTEKPDQVIVVDGQSEDGTAAIASSFAPKLPIEVLTSDQRNVGYQRNLGAKASQTEWLLFFDADNRIQPSYIEQIKSHVDKKHLDSFTSFIEADSNHPQEKLIATALNMTTLGALLIQKPTAFGACIGVKSEIFYQLGGFDPMVSYQEDSEFIQRLTNKGFVFQVLIAPTFTYSFRRFRREGTLNYVQKASSLFLKNYLLGFQSTTNQTDYPMLGGSYYDDTQPSPDIILDYKKVLREIRALSSTQRQRLLKVLHKTFDFEL